MRTVSVRAVADALYDCIGRASFNLGERETAALEAARRTETSPTGRAVLDQLLENARIACQERRPLCQDTGLAVVFLDIGQQVTLDGGDLVAAINDAVARACRDFHLRTSVVAHPLDRRNTGDNSPAVVHVRLVPGDRVRLRFAAKGGGCENMSRLAMLTPSAGRAGVVEFVVRTVREALANPCPPVVVGVGLGGNFEMAALAAKESLLRPLGDAAADPRDADLERELFAAINATGVGPMGLGGANTALAVHVASLPCHIAALPVAVNLDCHSHRHAETVL
ncbi:MAG TPA: fumarate hydratase [Phycisphaerae bacterium]|nr:fumarate hydratase [Phycisphaerae bacterium]HOI56233.1 fumarate hydratase [Phycisphaerae bacterium]